MYISQGRIQLLNKVGVHIRRTITGGGGGGGGGGGSGRLWFGKNIVHFL